MARTITIDIRTTADLKNITALSGAIKRLQGDLRSFSTTAKQVSQSFGTLAKDMKAINTGMQNITKQTRNATQVQADMLRTLRQAETLNRTITRSLGQRMTMTQRVVALEKQHKQAQDALTAAQNKYKQLIGSGTASNQELSIAKQKLDLAKRQVAESTKARRSIQDDISAYRQMKSIITSIEGEINDLVKANQKVPQSLVTELKKMQQNAAAFENELNEVTRSTKAQMTAEQRLTALSRSGLEGRTTQATHLSAVMKDVTKQTQEQVKAQEALNRAHAAEEAKADRGYIGMLKGITQEATKVASAEQRKTKEMQGEAATTRTLVPLTQRLAATYRQLQTALTSIMSFLRTLSATFGGVFRVAITTAQRTVSAFTRSAATMFAGLQRATQGVGAAFQRLGVQVAGSMQQATRSVQQFYNAGWSLLTSGYMLQNFGQRIFGGMAGSLDAYMSYEQALTRTAISAAGAGAPNPALIQELIFGLQRGRFMETPEGAPLPIMQFSAEEMAEGLYFYTSAIGQQVTTENMDILGPVVGQIMAMAAATRTGLETATKGVLNVAMEFGIDPRAAARGDQVHADWLNRIPALMGYLANISTMEVPDIAETFKMVGPMAHILSPDQGPGSGLLETMTLTYMASEMGLRGGNVGRGINQALTTLLDPTDKAIAAAASAWGAEFGDATKENWRAFFFDETGALEGGLPGFFEKLSQLQGSEATAVLAEIFTTNASRALIAIQQAVKQNGGIQGIMDDLAGPHPERFLMEAFLTTNDTIFANMQNLKNAWFAVTAEIIGVIDGPLKRALRFFADLMWEVSDTIRENPWIAKFVVGLLSIVAAVTTLIGSLMMMSGSLLLLMKAFSMLGGLAHPFLLFLVAAAKAGIILLPIIAALAVATGLLMAAWSSDFMGIRSAIEGAFKDFSFEEDIVPKFERVGQALRYTAAAFEEFTRGILIGQGSTATLGNWLADVFGPILGPYFYGQLLRASDALDNFRQNVMEFFTDLRSGTGTSGIQDFFRALYGFAEFFFTGQIQGANLDAWTNMMERLGIEDSIGALIKARETVLNVIATILNAFYGFRQQLQAVFEDIGDNFDAIFTRQNLMRAVRAFVAFVGGVFVGFAGAIVAAADAFELLTRAIANSGRAGEWINDLLEDLIGLRLTVEDVAQGIGFAVGTFLGLRLVAAITPFVGLIRTLVPLLISLTFEFVRLGVQLVLSTAQWIALTAAALANFVVMVATSAGVLGLVSAMGGLVGVLVVVAGLVLANLYNMDGWSGVVSGLWAMFEGFAGVMLIFVGLLLQLGQAVWSVIDSFVVFNASAEQMRAIGVALGLVVATLATIIGVRLVAALLLSAGAAIVQMVVAVASAIVGFIAWSTASFGLIGALAAVAAIAAVAYIAFKTFSDNDFASGINGLIEVINNLWDAFNYQGWEEATNLAVAGLKRFFASVEKAFWDSVISFQADVSTGIFEKGLGEVLSLLNPALQTEEIVNEEGKQFFSDRAAALEAQIAGYDAEINGIIAQTEQNKLAEKWGERLGSALNPWGGESGRGFVESLTDVPIIGDIWDMFSDALGMDKFSVETLMQELGFDKFSEKYGAQFQQATGMGLDDFLRNEYNQALTEYQQYERLVREKGVDIANAIYEANGQPIPTNPGKFDAWKADQLGQVEQTKEEILKSIEDMNKSMQDALGSMDLPSAMKGMFGQGSVGDVLGQIGEQLIQNIGDAGPWLNITELLADAAGMGMLGEDISGQNIHSALAPALEIVAQQTGMSINDIMKGIPKYIVPEEFLPLATAELLEAINEIPTSMFKTLDTLGTDTAAMFGVQFEEYGIEWSEVAAYAVGQAMAGTDWNLADYLASSWDISISEAEAYLASHGIDPNVLTNELFEDTKLFIDSMGGQVSLITEEWYTWLGTMTNDFADKTIEITQTAFDLLPDYVKIGFSNMGYTFVIGATDTYGKMVESASIVIRNFVDAYGPVGEEISRWTDETGAEWVTFKDLTGTEYTVAAPEYDAYIAALKAIEEATNATKKTWVDLWDDTIGMDWAKGGWGNWGKAPQGGEAAPAMPTIPGVPTPAQAATQGEETGKAWATGVTTSITTEIANLNLDNFDVQVFGDLGTSASEAFGTAFRTGMSSLFTTVGGDSGAYAPAAVTIGGPFDSIFRTYAIGAAKAFADQFRTSLSESFSTVGGGGTGNAAIGAGPFSGQFTQYGVGAATSFKTGFESAMLGWSPQIGRVAAATPQAPDGPVMPTGPQTSSTVVRVKVEVDTTAWDTAKGNLDTWTKTPKTVNINLLTFAFDATFEDAQNRLQRFTNTTWKTTLDASDIPFNEVLQDCVTRAGNFDNATWTTNLNANNIGFKTVYDGVVAALNWFDQAITYTSLSADASGFWNAVNSIPLYVGTRYVRIEGVPQSSMYPSGGLQPQASGGMTREPFQIVGERGFEFTQLPIGSRVYSNSRSQVMLRDAVRSAMNDVTVPISLEIKSAQLPRETQPVTTTEAFRSARQWEYRPSTYQRGDVHVEINNLNVSKELDVDKALERIDRATGRRMELARRGMIPFEESRTL